MFLATVGLVMSTGAYSQVMGGEIDYTSAGTICQGYLAKDLNKAGKRPGILIVHDWNGVDGYEESRAVQLAKLGYVALCADIYGKGVRPKNAQESGAQAGKYKSNRTLYRERLQSALDELKKDPNVDPNHVVAIGYCFGGTGVLEMARAGMAVQGVVSFHGGLDADPNMMAGTVTSKVLVLNGGDDQSATPEKVAALQKEFAGANIEIVAYPGAVHAFTVPTAGNDPSKGVAYNKDADEKSWAKMKTFFSALFK